MKIKTVRAKPTYAYAIKCRGVIDLDSIDMDRPAVIRNANKPAGQRVICVRISEIAEPAGIVAGRRVHRAVVGGSHD